MQRRTNLFYTSGTDSNFVTFSNYTESLTGSFISTNWKLFPSKFICLKVENLDTETKAEFIKHIAAYYENKLAFIRDWCVLDNRRIDETILPFEWLLEEFDKFFTEKEINWEITFISEIVEQNYNGVYADTICTIDGTDKPRTWIINENEDPDAGDFRILYKDAKNKPLSEDYLYGWYKTKIDSEESEYVGPSEYENVKPVFDGHDDLMEPYYSLFPKYTSISISDEGEQPASIDFNVIIPLYDLTNLNTLTNTNTIDESINLTTQIADNNEDKINIPIGIWFADTVVSLKRDSDTGYAPAWSLVLSSQFKPFPYSEQLNSDGVEGIQGIAYTEGAYVTFAQVLSRQNEIITNFSKLSSQIANLSKRIEEVDAKVNQLSTSYAIDGIHKEMILFKDQICNLLEQYNIKTDSALSWDVKFND